MIFLSMLRSVTAFVGFHPEAMHHTSRYTSRSARDPSQALVQFIISTERRKEHQSVPCTISIGLVTSMCCKSAYSRHSLTFLFMNGNKRSTLKARSSSLSPLLLRLCRKLCLPSPAALKQSIADIRCSLFVYFLIYPIYVFLCQGISVWIYAASSFSGLINVSRTSLSKKYASASSAIKAEVSKNSALSILKTSPENRR